MERMRLAPVPEECRYLINHVASYLMHISDIYLSMRSDINNWGSATQALTSAVQKEKMLQEILEDLKKVVTQTRETELVTQFMAEQQQEEENEGPISEECVAPINQLAARQLQMGDAYLFMATCYREEMEMPGFVIFFEDQAEVKRFQAKRFIRYLRKRQGTICLPKIEKPEIGNWGNAIVALTSALQMENVITKNLEDLNTLATNANDAGLLKFLKDFLIKQKRNTAYLERQISYEHQSEERRRQEMSEMTSKGEETSESSTASLPTAGSQTSIL
nr:uncharacterized protein LOC113192324 [Urocitellus parryii]